MFGSPEPLDNKADFEVELPIDREGPFQNESWKASILPLSHFVLLQEQDQEADLEVLDVTNDASHSVRDGPVSASLVVGFENTYLVIP